MVQAGKQRGAFILFEGIDRSGKTTQCSKLLQQLSNSQIKAELWRFPDRTTPLGQTINTYLTNGVQLNDISVHLTFSANRWERSEAMVSALEAGNTLVVDRYSFSGIAYTMAKELPGIGLEWCCAPEAGLPAPDIVFYMRVSPEAVAKRGGFGEERYEKVDFQKKVAGNFDALQGSNWVVIDADQPIDDIHDQIVKATAQLFSSGKLNYPVGRLYTAASQDSAADGSASVHLDGQAPLQAKGTSQAEPERPAARAT